MLDKRTRNAIEDSLGTASPNHEAALTTTPSLTEK
jgi:hypothetical protein